MEFAGISQKAIDSLVFSPTWKILPLPALSTAEQEKEPRIIIVPPSQAALRQEIADRLPQADVRLLTPQSIDDLARAVAGSAALRLCFVTRTPWRAAVPDEDVSAFFHLLKALGDKPAVKLDVFTDKAVASPLFESVTHPVDGVYVGLAQTLAKERPEWIVRSFSLQKLTADALQDLLRASLPTHPGTPVCIAEGRYGVAEMQPTTLSSWPAQSAFRQQGTWLGGKLAEYLAARYLAKLVILGRRPEAHDLLMRLRDLGAVEAHYHSVDLSDRAALQDVLDQYAVIHGVVHSALVLEDASLAAMSEQTLFNVLRPKVHGAYNLARALKGRTLDFCLFFSSIQSYIANPGQGNYTAACVAKDAFADLLHNGLMINSKIINWGFWGSVGVVASEHYRERMKKLQIGSIEVDEGLSVIERFLVTERRQITVVKASDLVLKRLNIAPHTALQEAMAKNVMVQNVMTQNLETQNVATQTPPQLKDQELAAPATSANLIPAYRTQDPLVARNEAMSAALQDYARWRLNQTSMPETIAPKFGKLVAAIRSIRAGLSPQREEVIRRYPELQGHIRLLDQCIENLPAILRGETNPLSVIFPDGGFELVEPVYRDNPIADYFNQVVARIVANLQKARAGRPLRIIEIGAGTGSTTQFVLPELAPDNVSYTFTDLSFAFLNKARRRFADYPFVEYKICNIEKPHAFEETFDVVIATNVIHATSDLPETLRQVRRLLRDDGVFVLNEITSCQDYATLTFGLTDGWWLSQDAYRIPNSPLLSGDSWRRLIVQAGFQDVDAHGGEDQQVIVGFAGADIQQRRAPQNSAQEEEVSPIEPSQGSAAAQTASQDGVASQASIEAFFQQVIAEVLQFDPSEIERDMPFSEMGVDSLISMELLKPIKDKTGYLPATILFEYPTIRQLAEHILTAGLAWREIEVSAEPVAVPVVEKTPLRRDSLAEIMNQVRAVIADTMMMDPEDVEADTPFQEYGVDSIISLELIHPLKEIFGYQPATVLFEYPSLRQLAEYLATTVATSSSDEATPDSTPAQSSETGQHADSSGADEPARDAQSFSDAPEKSLWRQGDIAIIGMSARLPKAQDVGRFWENLRQGRDCTDVIPAERWKQEGFLTDAPLNGRGSYTNRGAFIDDVDAFDHVFFNLTPNEAARMDPQERIMLEQTYRSMLDAGYTRKQWAGSDTAVFVGVMNGDYAWHSPVETSTAPATSLFWSMANRASYFFDWRGPSMAVDTACSASLTALHLACQALKNGDCEQAVVGGVNLITHPRHYEQLCGLHMLSRSEQCKPFGANADGFVDGEGVICLAMKRAEDAIRDNDRVYAFIKGSAINAGGRSNGYTAPNPEAQASLISKALQAAGVTPQEVGYVEAHGTGTELGDPIELRALSKSYGAAAPQSIRLGSVKSNVGHLESAAGLCGVLKAVLQMRHGEWVPSLHAEQLNPHLDFTQTPFLLNRDRCEWDAAAPRVSAVSSFGAGGGNAHVVIQGVAQALASPGTITDTAQGATRREIYVIPLSHHSSAGLQQTLDCLRDWLQKEQVDMDALAYTLACARDHERFRRALVCRDQADLIQQLGRDLQMTGVASRKGTSGQAQQASPQRLTRDNAENVTAMYEAGDDLPWRDFYPQRRLAAVPEYGFIRHRHWIDSVESNFKGFHSLTHAHRINGRAMAPAAWTLSTLCESADDSGFANIMWKDMITDPHNVEVIEEGGRTLFVGRGGFTEYCIAERTRDENVPQHISTVLARLGVENPLQAIDIDNAPRRSQAEIYGDFQQRGYDYGAPLQGIRWAQIRPGLVRAFLQVDHDWGQLVSPALLDAGLQLAILAPASAAESSGYGETAVFMPYHLGRLVVNRLPDNEAVYGYCLEKTTAQASKARRFDFYFTDRRGEVLIMMEDMVSVVVRPHAEDEVDTPPRQVLPEPRFEVFDLS
ncbi:beta-ketoacyl synthase N-terminal-like domain-containing protein [Solemya velum gill symbiont]|uniref:beta-ketoacyl synthase N-terminal-like domain-containing protein n=1 Tax=Solemya velum gill symbiont TaxID=2340 RepID=UPI0018A83D98|nr:beta-ketoacyl synthase N-terminal-like domain-containing protein [Solemya velum gill symbiont]